MTQSTRLLPYSGVALLLMLGTALVLARTQRSQHLGQPGLRLVDLGLTNEIGEAVTTNSVFLPERPLNYQSVLRPVAREELNWLPADTTFGRRLYSTPDGFEALVTAVLMGTDRTSIHKPEYCLPGQGFQIVRRTPTRILIDRPHRYELPVMRLDAIREIQMPNGGGTARVGAVYVYWFVSASRLSNDHFQRMWWLATDLVRTGELQRWAYLGCLAACPPGREDAAYARLEALIQALVPEVQTTVGPLAQGGASTLDAAAVAPTNVEVQGTSR